MSPLRLGKWFSLTENFKKLKIVRKKFLWWVAQFLETPKVPLRFVPGKNQRASFLTFVSMEKFWFNAGLGFTYTPEEHINWKHQKTETADLYWKDKIFEKVAQSRKSFHSHQFQGDHLVRNFWPVRNGQKSNLGQKTFLTNEE